MSATAIEWTQETWNPVTGCSKVSAGCAHCYIERTPPFRMQGRRFARGATDVRLHPERLEKPLHWRRPRMVFVNSLSDLFHEQVPDEYLARIWDVMVRCPQHTFQVLTKRPERMVHALGPQGIGFYAADGPVPCPQPNIWMGVTIENRRYVGRADLLRETPAAVRFISAEPLLGPLVPFCSECGGAGTSAETNERCECMADPWLDGSELPPLNLDGIDWLIVGGESGLRHRTVRPEWVRSLRWAAEATGTAFFFKQWGGRTPKAGGRELDGRTWDELPTREGVAA